MKRIIIATLAVATLATSAMAQSATTKPECTTDASCAKMTECKAKPFHKWLPAHKAGDVNAKTGQPYKRDSNGQCRLDGKAVQAAIAEGKIKQ